MAAIPVYNNFAEKSAHFKIVNIENIKQFDDLLETHNSSNGIYRGISNAKYKIFTSLQRQLINEEIENFDLANYLKKIRQNNILRRYFKAFNILPTNLALYSFFQHYHAPTPLIDFSTDILKSMYFALEDFDAAKHTEDGSINDYFSVFFIADADVRLLEIPQVLEYQKKTKQFIENLRETYGEKEDDVFTANYLDIYLGINTTDVFLIDQRDEYAEVYNTYNNIRIIAQDGLFIHNTYHDKPLEEALKDFFKEAAQYTPGILEELPDENSARLVQENREQVEKNKIVQRRLEQNIITSFEIKKSLIPNILKNYKLTKDDIYPDPIDICSKIFRDSIS